jgi:hypothetical protein
MPEGEHVNSLRKKMRGRGKGDSEKMAPLKPTVHESV